MLKLSIKKSIYAIGVSGAFWLCGYLYLVVFKYPWNEILSLVPPLCAISCALITQQVFLSFAGSILVGAFLKTLQTPDSGSILFTSAGWFGSVLSDHINIFILSFVVFIMSLISILTGLGGFHALIDWLKQYSVSRTKTLWMTYVAGLLIFIDDYANTILVGSTMKPLIDKFKISREKLAFLVDSTSAPVAGISLVSTWVGYEMGLFSSAASNLGLEKDGFALFVDAISFRFYCIMMLIFIFLYLWRGKDFGPMYRAEDKAINQNLESESNDPISVHHLKPVEGIQGQKRTVVIPLIFFAILTTLGFWYDGGGFGESDYRMYRPGDWIDVFSFSENNALVLAVSSGLTLIFSIIYAVFYVRITLENLSGLLFKGLKLSLFPLSILILAWVLKNVCDDLNVASYLAGHIKDHIPIGLFPTVVFMFAILISFSTGTSWGTMAILIPIALPIAFTLDEHQYGLCMMITMGAVLDGAIMGDHCSPISDTTLLSSFSTGCPHIRHVQTQVPYVLMVSFVAVVFGYLPAGYGYSSVFNFIFAGLFFFLILELSGKKVVRKND